MTAAPRRTRFDAYAAGVADGRADRAAGREEPREDVGADWPWHRLPYGAGYFEGFGRDEGKERFAPAPLGADLAAAVAESLVVSWWWRTRPDRLRSDWVVLLAALFAVQHLQLRWRSRDVAGAAAVLVAPGRIARNQGISSAWWIMRRRGIVGEGFSTALGRYLAFLIVLRLERRADERRWRDYAV